MEQDADKFAANFLIPKQDLQGFLDEKVFDDHAIANFASAIGIASGIVVGRLHHEGCLSYRQGNDLR